jgi:hypothetical protein
MPYRYSTKMFTRRAKPIRINGDKDNQNPDKCSSTVFFMFRKAEENHDRLEPTGLNQTLVHIKESGVVDMETGLEAGEPTNRDSIPRRARDSLVSNTSTPAPPPQPLMQCTQGDLSLEVKRPGQEVDHLPMSSAEVQECVGGYTSTAPRRAFTACRGTILPSPCNLTPITLISRTEYENEESAQYPTDWSLTTIVWLPENDTALRKMHENSNL